tara:strand:- start:3281 stop:3478 length:198 start_codon:yes stop_codon:yes gene_type:complete
MNIPKPEQEEKLEFNKEEKYRNEIFELLKSSIEISETDKCNLFQDLFIKSPIDNEKLLGLIKSLK